KVTVSPDAAGLVPGRKYGYRMVLENGRGLTARSARRSFVYRLGFKLVGGTPGADRLFGGAERDDVRGRGGADLLRAGGGADVLNGGDGDDRAHAGRGADVVIGGRGRDRLYGGRGADLVKARDGRRDRIGCGAGHDRVEADALDVVTGCEVVERG
ncbi:MAG: hypothetical protein QOG86_2244, partial [Thermoleophilaceae bacterium]|nr:hypothetical protein [Thermoleophilaceae bacterium]